MGGLGCRVQGNMPVGHEDAIGPAFYMFKVVCICVGKSTWLQRVIRNLHCIFGMAMDRSWGVARA